jgi:hypothetical protein
MSDLIPASTEDGIRGHIREDRPEAMKLDNGNYFIPIEHDAKLHRIAFDKLIDAIDNHYPDSPEFAALYVEAKEMIGANA